MASLLCYVCWQHLIAMSSSKIVFLLIVYQIEVNHLCQFEL